MTEYGDFYENTDPFDEDVEAFKDHLRKAVKKEVQDRVELLTTQNAELTRRLENLGTLEREAKAAKYSYEMKYRNAEHEAKQAVRKEGLRKLLELLREPRYRVCVIRDPQPKCGKCNEQRRLPYTTPRGREAYDACECAATTERWDVEELLVHEVARRSSGILAWYAPVGRYFDDSDTVASPRVVKAADGHTLEEMAKNPTDYGFPTAEAAMVLATALNKADA